MKFGKNMIIYAGADIIGRAMGLFASPFMTRLLTTEEYGSYGLLTAVWALVSLFQFGGMDTSYQIFRVRAVQGQAQILTSATFVATLSTFVVWGLFSVAALSGPWLRNYAKVSQCQLGWYLLGLIPTILTSWYLYVFRFQHKALPFARTNFVNKVISSLVLVILLFVTPPKGRLTILFAGIFMTQGLSWAWALWELRRSDLWPYSKKLLSKDLSLKMLRYGAFFIPGAVTYAAVVSGDRLMVGWLAGPKEVAMVHLALNLGSVALMLKMWFSLVWNPSLIEWLATKNPEIYLPKLQLALNGLSAIFLTLTCLLAVWSDLFITILYPHEYFSVGRLVPFVVLVGTCSAFSLIGIATIVMDPSPKYYFKIYIYALIVTVFITLLAVPHIGALGAILGTLGAELFILGGWILRGKFLVKNLDLNWNPMIVLMVISGLFIAIYHPGIFLTHGIFWERILMTFMIFTIATVLGFSVLKKFITYWRNPVYRSSI